MGQVYCSAARKLVTHSDGECEGEVRESGDMGAEVKQSGRWQCRLWWPRHFTVVHPTEPMALIGWASLSSCCCLDLVVATACPMPSSSSLEVICPLFIQCTVPSPGIDIVFVQRAFWRSHCHSL